MSREIFQPTSSKRNSRWNRANGEVARQRKVISTLEADGHPTVDAREPLKDFLRRVRTRLHVTDRDRLIEELSAGE